MRPKAVVLGHKGFNGERLFCIRLTLPKQDDRKWFFKPYSAFVSLGEALTEGAEKSVWGQQGALSHIPELVPDEKFGIQRRLSLLGLNDFLTKQQAALQSYLDELFVQLPDLAAEPHLEQFFSAATQLDAHRALMDEAIMEAGANVTIRQMAGYWKLKGSQHIWTLASNGKTMLNGKHRGEEYDLSEVGSGAQRTITRPDGWQVDIERSSENTTIWCKSGYHDAEWTRENAEQAEALVKKYAAKRAALEKNKAAKEAALATEKLAAVQEGTPKADAGEAAKA